MIEAESADWNKIEIKVNGYVVYSGGENQLGDLSAYNLMLKPDREGRRWMIFDDEILSVKFDGKVAKIQTTGNFLIK